MKIQRFIEDGDYKQVIQVCQDSLQLDAWRQAVGTELILSWTYCMLFEETAQVKDVVSIRQLLEQLNEDQIEAAPEFFVGLAYKIDAELNRLETIVQVDDKETQLKEALEASGTPPDL